MTSQNPREKKDADENENSDNELSEDLELEKESSESESVDTESSQSVDSHFDSSQSNESDSIEDAPVKTRSFSEKSFSFKKILEPFHVKDSAPVTYGLIGLNFVLFAALVFASGAKAILSPEEATLIEWGANFGPLTLSGEYWRIVTNLFLHIGFLHLFLNMFVLWDFGVSAEKIFGSKYFFLLYFLSGAGGSCVTAMITPYITSAGASGAIFGVIGGLIAVLQIKKDELPAGIYKRIKEFIIFLFLITAILGLFVNIDNGAHFGGFAFGFLCGRLFKAKGAFIQFRFISVILITAIIFGLFKIAESTPFDFDGTYSFRKSIYLIHHGKSDDALAAADRLIAKNPGNAIGYVVKGAVLSSLFMNDQAVQSFTKAIELEPKNASFYAKRANSLILDGKPKLALDDCAKAKELGLQNPSLLYSQLMANVALRKFDAALKLCNKLLKENSERENQYLLNRATIYRKLGNKSEALLDLDSLLEKDPNNLRALESRTFVYYIQGRIKEANQEIKKAEAIAVLRDEFGYLSREYASLAFDHYHQAILDTRTFLAKFKDKKENIIYSAIVGRQAAQFRGDSESIEYIDSAVSDFSPKTYWPYPVLQFIQGKISEEELLKIAGQNNNKLTECKTFIGVDYEIKDDIEQARKNYSWVMEKGNPFYLEYDLAQIRLLKIKESGAN